MNNRKTDISIVVPCYNANPVFLNEAIESVKKYSGDYKYEIIIVNDGSTSEVILHFLNQIAEPNIQVIFQNNRGPAAARNTGVQKAQSNYILFLDSDDRLLPGYIKEGIDALNTNSKAAVVYARALSFGDGSRANFTAIPFDIAELLTRNFIPMCAIVRKKAWENTGGIDENLIQYEDWEFWINIYKAGWEFIFINKPMFEYRLRNDSLIAQQPEENFKKAVEYIYKKHWDLVYQVFHQLYATRIIYNNDKKRPLRSFIKYSKNKLIN